MDIFKIIFYIFVILYDNLSINDIILYTNTILILIVFYYLLIIFHILLHYLLQFLFSILLTYLAIDIFNKVDSFLLQFIKNNHFFYNLLSNIDTKNIKNTDQHYFIKTILLFIIFVLLNDIYLHILDLLIILLIEIVLNEFFISQLSAFCYFYTKIDMFILFDDNNSYIKLIIKKYK